MIQAVGTVLGYREPHAEHFYHPSAGSSRKRTRQRVVAGGGEIPQYRRPFLMLRGINVLSDGIFGALRRIAGASRPMEMARAERRRKQAFIVLPSGLASRGGIGQNLRNLLDEWHRREDAPSCRVINSWHVEWKMRRSPISPLYFIGAIALIAAARFRGRLGLLHLNMSEGGSILRKALLVWLGVLLRVPVIVHVRGGRFADQLCSLPSLVQVLLRVTLERARFVIALGRFWRDLFVVQIGMDPARVMVIPHGVPGPHDPRIRARATSLGLLFLGRLGEHKGTPDVLQALADPRMRMRDWTLVLAGDGEVEAMRARAEALGIADRCTFTGWLERPQVMELLARSDVLLLPSRAEGLPNAILEAMAYGLAVVTTPVGAIEDAITDHETGLLVPVGDAEALAAALLELLSDDDLRKALGHAAHARYLREFTVAKYSDRIRDLYRQCGVA